MSGYVELAAALYGSKPGDLLVTSWSDTHDGMSRGDVYVRVHEGWRAVIRGKGYGPKQMRLLVNNDDEIASAYRLDSWAIL